MLRRPLPRPISGAQGGLLERPLAHYGTAQGPVTRHAVLENHPRSTARVGRAVIRPPRCQAFSRGAIHIGGDSHLYHPAIASSGLHAGLPRRHAPGRCLPVILFLLALTACVTGRVPDFATKPYEPFNREDTVAIAMREWRLFGQPVDDEPPDTRPNPAPEEKPEREPGLWQRVGEYWWVGQGRGADEAGWTGKHDQNGKVFPALEDGEYAWSAAFISYVMRIAGAGARFPYAANHATYVNAAAAHRSPILRARAPESYAPKRGDLICRGRKEASKLRFSDLPTDYIWLGHCAIVVNAAPGVLSTIAGNVDDAVTMVHVPVTDSGMLATPDGSILDTRYRWFVVLEVLYDAQAEPQSDE